MEIEAESFEEANELIEAGIRFLEEQGNEFGRRHAVQILDESVFAEAEYTGEE